MTQQHRFELLARFEAGTDRVLAGSRQITNGFVRLRRDHDRGQITGPGEVRQRECVAPVSLDPITGLARNHRRGDDLASIAARTQLTRQAVTARTRLVHDQQLGWSAAMRQGFLDLGKNGTGGSQEPRRRPAGYCDRNRNGILMDIQTDKSSGNLTHSLPPVACADHADRRSVCGSAHFGAQPTVMEADLLILTIATCLALAGP